MYRRIFLVGAGTSLMAIFTGCLGETEPTQVGCPERLQDDDADSEDFLQDGQRPESDGAEAFLRTVAEETGGRTGFDGRDDTWRIKFSETSDLWTIRYSGDVAAMDPFREEIAALSTTFAAHRPAGISLNATALHECTIGTWHVCAGTAAEYERGDLDREAFVELVQETAERVNTC